jgi:hypothetical protein
MMLVEYALTDLGKHSFSDCAEAFAREAQIAAGRASDGNGNGDGVHERRIVSPHGCDGGESLSADEPREVYGAEIGGEMAGGGRAGVGSGSEDGEAGERWMPGELRARGASARAGAGSGSGIAVHGDGMRRCGVPKYAAAAGIPDHHARGGAHGAHCHVPLGDARLVVAVVNCLIDRLTLLRGCC